MCMHARYCYWLAGPFYNSWLLTSLLRVSHWLATLLNSTQRSWSKLSLLASVKDRPHQLRKGNDSFNLFALWKAFGVREGADQKEGRFERGVK